MGRAGLEMPSATSRRAASERGGRHEGARRHEEAGRHEGARRHEGAGAAREEAERPRRRRIFVFGKT